MNPVNNQLKKHASARGYTLVELMVGLLLSVFIVMMTIAYLVTSAKTFSVQTNEALIQENARFTLDALSRLIREAGSDPSNSLPTELSPLFAQGRCALDANRSNVASDSNACTFDELSTGSDRLSITKAISSRATACDGSDILVEAGKSVLVATILWSGDIDQDGIRSLYCQSYNIDTHTFIGRAAPLIEGVDLVQFQYGLDTDMDGVIDQYQNQEFRRSQILQTKSNSNLTSKLRPHAKAIRFAVLISPGSGLRRDQVVESSGARSYQLLDGDAVEFNDRLPRSVYSSTVMLPSSN